MQHGEREYSLMIEVARLRQETERLGSACIAWGARVDELSAVLAAANARADAAEGANTQLAILLKRADAETLKAQEALAAARRSLGDMDRLFLGTLAGILTAIPGDPEQIDDWLRGRIAHAKYQYDESQKARAALAVPGAGEEGRR